jgi:hypothetical protein
MREVALTLRELGIDPAVTEGVVLQQERLGRLPLQAEPEDGFAMLDAVRAALSGQKPEPS